MSRVSDSTSADRPWRRGWQVHFRHVMVTALALLTGSCTGSGTVDPAPTVLAVTVRPLGDPPGTTAREYTMVTPVSIVPMSATSALSDGTTLDVTYEAVWTSSDTTVATVNSAGLVRVDRHVTGACRGPSGLQTCSTTITAEFMGSTGSFRFAVPAR